MSPELDSQLLVLWQLWSSSVECRHFEHRRQCEEEQLEVQLGVNEGMAVTGNKEQEVQMLRWCL